MFPRGAVFTFRVLAYQKDGVGGSSRLGLLVKKSAQETVELRVRKKNKENG